MRYWLMKSEPSEYSIDDLEKDGKSSWFGVRNYQARNFMSKEMEDGDRVLFYHSNCKVPGVVGLARVSGFAHPDETQFFPGKYFEPRATRERPVWFCVDVAFEKKLQRTYSLQEIRDNPKLAGMKLLQKGNRLSITPVTREEFEEIVASVSP
ncbi:MAG: EVE domain-containing protein [Patescibacteria group bacterium]